MDRSNLANSAPALMSMILLCLSLTLPITIHSLVFDLPSGRTKCISEELRINTMSIAHYKISLDPPHKHKISIRVSGPYGENIHYAENIESGNFAFTATQSAQHTVCFWSSHFDISTTFPVNFDWKIGVSARDLNWTAIAKKEKISVMELELKKLEESVHSIHEEMIFLREREEEMQMLNQTINSTMALLSLLSLCICLAVVGLQLWHLKIFFERKKII
ncbi:transmembrane emp24 domain-containing protein p24delta9-like [Tasmannia lanceolata]|uniref:transmembrane emp24 domain-containing protein p24delta9-like n=1 Tax=Tasmannia lanceolata TaxID=3420 RepID=UPI0040648EC7